MAGALCSCGFALHYTHPNLIHDAPWGLSDLWTLGAALAAVGAYLLWSRWLLRGWRRA